jgi:hypothetical protein
MASKARALVQRFKALDGESQYHLVGAVLAVPCSLAVGVKILRDRPHEVGTATFFAVLMGFTTTMAWPLAAPTLGTYGLFYVIDKKLN